MSCDRYDFKEGDTLILPVDNRPHRIEKVSRSSGGSRLYDMEVCPFDATNAEKAYPALNPVMTNKYCFDYVASPGILIGNRRGRHINRAKIGINIHNNEKYTIWAFRTPEEEAYSFEQACDKIRGFVKRNPAGLQDMDSEWTVCRVEHRRRSHE